MTPLTVREYEVMVAYARLGKMRTVAADLRISYHTVKAHCQNAFGKLGVGTDSEAFIALGWLRLPGEAERAEFELEARLRDAEEARLALTTAIIAVRMMRTPESESPAVLVSPVGDQSTLATTRRPQ